MEGDDFLYGNIMSGKPREEMRNVRKTSLRWFINNYFFLTPRDLTIYLPQS